MNLADLQSLTTEQLVAYCDQRRAGPMPTDVYCDLLDGMYVAVVEKREHPCKCGAPSMLIEDRNECRPCGLARQQANYARFKARKAK